MRVVLAAFGSAVTPTIAVGILLQSHLCSLNAQNSAYALAQPKNTEFTPPRPNGCDSRYDQFYVAEPGVYAYWALCERGLNPAIYDYAGPFDFDKAHSAWSKGPLKGVAPGPLADDESAVQVSADDSGVEVAQNLPVNRNAGTIAAWVNSKTVAGEQSISVPFSLGAIFGNSSVGILIGSHEGKVCFGGEWHNATSTPFGSAEKGSVWMPEAKCGYRPNTWHRVVETWAGGRLSIYLDGKLAAVKPYSGSLDNTVYTYRLFINNSGIDMALAKISVSNREWDPPQIVADWSPATIIPPKGGVYISGQRMGTIHRDVLGYADNNADLSSPPLVAALLNGLRAGGVTSLRYAGGYGGISADTEDWQGGPPCSPTRGRTMFAQNQSTVNKLDTYITRIAQPLGLHIGFTVNYGTNPPLCDAGGDPNTNGAALVDYANNKKHYNIQYWEIGNEVYSRTTEPDFHPEPNTGVSYAASEPAFYRSMKRLDPGISVGIPVGTDIVYDWLQNFTLPAMSGAQYDAIIWHNYPLRHPVSDGATLYQDRVAGNTIRTRSTLLVLQTLLLNAGKSPDAIWVTEWNGDVNGAEWSRQSMGAVMPLFAAIQLAEYMRAGVRYAAWWAQGMSATCMRYFYDWSGQTAYNWWSCGGLPLTYQGSVAAETMVGLKPGDITPAARAFQLFSETGFAAEGERMIETYTDRLNAPWLLSYAATHGAGRALLLINRDKDQPHQVPVRINDQSHGNAVKQWTYGREQYDYSRYGNWRVEPRRASFSGWDGTFTAELPPWSVNVFVFVADRH